MRPWRVGIASLLFLLLPALTFATSITATGSLSGADSTSAELYTANCFDASGICAQYFIAGSSYNTFLTTFTVNPGGPIPGTISSATLDLGFSTAVTGATSSELGFGEVGFCWGCGPTPASVNIYGYQYGTFREIQSGAMSVAWSPSYSTSSTQSLDLLALGFGPELAAGDPFTITFEPLVEFGYSYANTGFDAYTYTGLSSYGSYGANGLLTVNYTPVIPEPASLLLLGGGLLGMARLLRKRWRPRVS